MKTNTFTFPHNIRSAILVIVLLTMCNGFSQKVQLALTETWENGNWRNYAQTTNTYDNNHYLTAELVQLSMPNGWLNHFQTDFRNNLDGTVNMATTQTWNPLTNNWQNSKRVTYTYETTGKMATETTELWVAEEWQITSKLSNNYDIGGNLNWTTQQNWDRISNSWVNVSRSVYEYNANNTINVNTVKSWNPVISNWDNFERNTYVYNASDKLLTTTIQRWLEGAWTNHATETNVYDSSGFLTNANGQAWISKAWSNDMRYSYENNANGTISQSLTQSYHDGGWNNEVRFKFTYDNLLSAEHFSSDEFTVFPNPAQNAITLSTTKQPNGLDYTIADQTGRTFLNGTLDSRQTAIDVKSLASGIYYIWLGPEKLHSVKMIKD